MASVRPYIQRKVFIDGIEVIGATASLELDSYDAVTIKKAVNDKRSNVRATIDFPEGRFTFQIKAYEHQNGDLHFYGPLRSMFPDLFKDKELLEWQIAYCNEFGIDTIKLWRTDSIFDTAQATNFRRGYLYAKEH